MTIPTDISSQTFLGNNVTSTFTCNFVPGASDGSNLQVATYTSSTIIQILPANLYSVNIGAPAAGEIWPTSFTVTYPLSGPAMSNNMFLSVSRILPFTQDIPYSNQGNIWPTAVETGVDTLEMQIQQLASRSTQFRGVWKSNVLYNLGDIVQDGTNGANTNNYYICQLSNTSSVWSTDLAAGDWALAVQAIIPSSAAPTITLSGAVAGSGTTSIVTTQQAQSVSNSALFFMSNNTIKSNISGALGMPGDNTFTAIMDALFGTLQGTILTRGPTLWQTVGPGSSGTVLTAQGLAANPLFQAFSGGIIIVSEQFFTSTTTYTPSAGMVYCIAIVQAAGGSGAAAGGSNAGSGGGSGAWAIAVLSAATIGASQSITIGAPGAGIGNASVPSAGNAASATSLGSIISCPGGLGGVEQSAPALGSGSTGAVTGGNIGVPGKSSITILTTAGGGQGADSVFGAGGVGTRAAGVGNSGTGYGSGSSGSTGNGLGTQNGQGGFVYIIEFCT